MRFIIFCLMLLLPSVLLADVFTPPPTDKSIDFLGYIFGPTIGSVRLGGATNPALLHMFERFNTVVIAIGTLIISYIAIISTVNTAQEGQVMGRKWNSIWIPLRSTLGMLLIIPAPNSGYSVAQNIVIWCILQGVGAADSIWNGVLDDLGNGLSATQAINRSANDIAANRVYDALELIGAEMADALLHSAVCMQTIHRLHSGTAMPPVGSFNTPNANLVRSKGALVQPYTTRTANNINSADHAEYSGALHIGIAGDPEFANICGKYSITSSTHRNEWENSAAISIATLQAKAYELYQHKIWALELMLQNFSTIANNLVDEAVSPRDAQNRLIGLTENPIFPGGYRNSAINTYREILKFQVKPQNLSNMQHIIHEGKNNGWLSAGSFYFTLNQSQTISFFADITKPPTTQFIPRCTDPSCRIYSTEQLNYFQPDLRNFLQYGPEISYMGTRLWDAKVYIEHDVTTISDRLSLHQVSKEANKDMNVLQGNMLNLLRDMMQEQHSDPLIAQGKFGSSIMLLSERAWLDAQNELHVLLNRAEEGYTPITKELMQRINNLNERGALAITIYSIIWIIGAILAVYIPLVPYLIFTIGVVGWLLLVIEAVLAAPILAISFMLPTTDEMGKGLQGLLLLLNIILRPVLMLFGFILATRLYQVAVKLVNFGMLSNFDTLNTGESMFAWVAILMLYATFIIALANKCFSLIYALPDKLLRWMGGIPEQTDPSFELQTSKSALIKGADTVNKVSMGIPQRSFARLQARANQLSPPDAVST